MDDRRDPRLAVPGAWPLPRAPGAEPKQGPGIMGRVNEGMARGLGAIAELPNRAIRATTGIDVGSGTDALRRGMGAQLGKGRLRNLGVSDDPAVQVRPLAARIG